MTAGVFVEHGTAGTVQIYPSALHVGAHPSPGSVGGGPAQPLYWGREWQDELSADRRRRDELALFLLGVL